MGKINAPGGKKSWALNCVDFAQERREAELFGDSVGCTAILAGILRNRGFSDPASAVSFLGKKSELLCDQMLLADITAAVERITEAVRKGERIVVYGDYDVDGVTSVCALMLYLESIGGNVSYFIPSRCSDGYGLAKGSLEALAADGTSLVVTVDTGITACAEAEYAKELGLDVIITDHHECRSVLPEAVAVVNPRRPDCAYPFKYLAGVGVVFKLICAVECALHRDEDRIDCIRRMCSSYADLVALGTIADVMPITGENRLIVSLGLSMLERTERPGLRALIDAANSPDGVSRHSKRRKMTSGYVGYTIAPRINAAGRISEASIAVELLLCGDEAKAAHLADKLCEINRMRQSEENRIAEEAVGRVASECDLENDRIIVLSDDGWHQGIIGIVASRISEKYSMPAILISFEGGDPELGKGSGRSVGDINLVDALDATGEFLVKYGGHALAAGLSIKRETLPLFKEKINRYIDEKYPRDNSVPALYAEMELEPSDITLDNALDLLRLEPYGVANPTPAFVMRDMTVEDLVPIGGNKHIKLMLGRDGATFQALCFGSCQEELDIIRGDRVDVLFNLDINEFQNVRTVQLIVRDIAFSGADAEAFRRENGIFLSFRDDPTAPVPEAFVPTREDFSAVYVYLRNQSRKGHELLGLRISAMAVGIPMLKMKYILMIFSEMKLMTLEWQSVETYRFGLMPQSGKTDLERSEILCELRKRTCKSE